ncbi:MAG: MFS transporter [Planctomycetota bacterium]
MPDRVPPSQCRKALTIFTWEGMFSSFHGALIGGIFVTWYVIDLGGKNIHYALLTAIPTLAAVTQVLAAYWLQYLHQRKTFTIITSTISRFAWLIIAIIPFLFIKSTSLSIFFAVYLLLNILSSMSANSYLSWMVDVIPIPIRGRYLGIRLMLCTIVAGVAGLAGGYFIEDYLPKWDKEILKIFSFLITPSLGAGESIRFIGYGIIYFIAVLIGAIPALVLLFKQYEPPFNYIPPAQPSQKTSDNNQEQESTKKSLLSYMKEISKSPNFKKLLFVMIIWNIINGFSAPFWLPYVIKDLQMSIKALTICGFLGNICRIISLPIWGKLIDRFGNKPIIIFAMYVIGFHPLYYVLSTPNFTALIYLDGISSGIMWAGVEIATLNLLFGASPKKGKEMYYAIYMALTGLANAVPQFIAGWVIDMVAQYRLLSLTPVQILLWFVAVGRFVCQIWMVKIVDSKEKSVLIFVSYLLTQMRDGFGFFRFFIPFKRHNKPAL